MMMTMTTTLMAKKTNKWILHVFLSIKSWPWNFPFILKWILRGGWYFFFILPALLIQLNTLYVQPQMLLAATSSFVSTLCYYILLLFYHTYTKNDQRLFISLFFISHFIFGWLWNWKNWRACIIASFTSHNY